MSAAVCVAAKTTANMVHVARPERGTRRSCFFSPSRGDIHTSTNSGGGFRVIVARMTKSERRTDRLMVAATLVCLVCAVGALGEARAVHVPTITDWSSIEKLEQALKAATALPLSSQKLILKKIGEVLVAVGEGPHCNVFGGTDSCVPVPSSSDYAKLCDAYNHEVDCAYEMEALQGIHQDPDSFMRDRLQRDHGFPPCPKCYAALHKFWCAQTVPACGTFDKVIDEILPMISAVALKKATPVVALQGAVLRMIKQGSLGLPCKKMCNAITDTCGCGQAVTFGEVMTSIHDESLDGLNTNMSANTAKEVFQNIWDVPVCDLFSDDFVPGFTGVCDVATEEPKCEWCSRRKHPRNIHQQIVAQIAQTFSGIMQGGLQTVLSEAGGAKHKGSVGAWNWGLDDSAEKEHHQSHTGLVVVLFSFFAVALMAFAIAAKVHRDRQNTSQYIDLNSMGYTPPVL